MARIPSIHHLLVFIISIGFIIVNLFCKAGNILYNSECKMGYLEYQNYIFKLEKNCNLVLYEDGSPIESSNSGGFTTGCVMCMENDGNLVIYDKDGKAIWSSASSSNTKDGDYALIVLRDRNVVIYGSILWSTNTTDTLAVGNWTTVRSPFNIINQGGDNATVQSSSTGGIGQGGANAMARPIVHRAQGI